jgi:hypothetical protein
MPRIRCRPAVRAPRRGVGGIEAAGGGGAPNRAPTAVAVGRERTVRVRLRCRLASFGARARCARTARRQHERFTRRALVWNSDGPPGRSDLGGGDLPARRVAPDGWGQAASIGR